MIIIRDINFYAMPCIDSSRHAPAPRNVAFWQRWSLRIGCHWLACGWRAAAVEGGTREVHHHADQVLLSDYHLQAELGED